jgi:hypothetical protein
MATDGGGGCDAAAQVGPVDFGEVMHITENDRGSETYTGGFLTSIRSPWRQSRGRRSCHHEDQRRQRSFFVETKQRLWQEVEGGARVSRGRCCAPIAPDGQCRPHPPDMERQGRRSVSLTCGPCGLAAQGRRAGWQPPLLSWAEAH